MPDVKLKICGVTSVKEARMLRRRTVDFVGLNFVPTSSRCISFDTAQQICTELRDSQVRTVAIFQDQPLQYISDYVDRLGIDCVQLHGRENNELISHIKNTVIKSITSQSYQNLSDYIRMSSADYFLLDRNRQGHGERVSLDLASQLCAEYPNQVFLSGGLAPDNLSETLQTVRPYAIDIAGGVRTGNEIDESKVATCLRIIRASS